MEREAREVVSSLYSNQYITSCYPCLEDVVGAYFWRGNCTPQNWLSKGIPPNNVVPNLIELRDSMPAFKEDVQRNLIYLVETGEAPVAIGESSLICFSRLFDVFKALRSSGKIYYNPKERGFEIDRSYIEKRLKEPIKGFLVNEKFRKIPLRSGSYCNCFELGDEHIVQSLSPEIDLKVLADSEARAFEIDLLNYLGGSHFKPLRYNAIYLIRKEPFNLERSLKALMDTEKARSLEKIPGFSYKD